MATQVFISYCQEDANTANQICGSLENAGITCWIAPRNVPPGQEWPEAIAGGIRGSRILVLLLSSHSHRSKQIARECELADRNGLSIVTFRLEEVNPPEALEYFLTNLQWIDGFGSNLEAAMGTLLHTIRWRLSLPETAPPVRLSRPMTVVNPPIAKPRSRKKIWIGIGLAVGILWLMIAYAVDENSRKMYVPVPTPERHAEADTDADGRQTPMPAPMRDPHTSVSGATGESVAGTWTGTYYCNGMGFNQMQLTISAAGGNEVDAIMQFAVPTGTPGAYDMHGTLEPATDAITLMFTRWRYVPPGVWTPANLQGQADTASGVIKGRVLSAACGAFEVHRQ